MNEAFEIFWRSLENLSSGFVENLPRITAGLFIFGIFILIAKLVSALVRRLTDRADRIRTLPLLVGRLTSFLISIIGLLIALVVVFPTFSAGDLITGLGITSVAIGFAFKDILQNFFAGILILWRQPFRVGDEIKSGDYEGVVEEINTRSTRVRTYDGERAVLPNGEVYTNAILVRTAFAKRRVKFVVGIGYKDSIEDARRIIHGVLAKIDGVLTDPQPWVYLSELAPSSVNFTVYFWVLPRQANLLRVLDRALTEVKLALDRAQIDIPYPHQVVLIENERDGAS